VLLRVEEKDVRIAPCCGQEPDYDNPINRGSHCCKGAAVRDDVLSERRLRYPVKLVSGQWNRISWDQAIDEIGQKLMKIREKSVPESVYWLGSAKFTNEAANLNRKLAAFWGTNNSDHHRANAVRDPGSLA
jgi:formate dehydrogenase major subunit